MSTTEKQANPPTLCLDFTMGKLGSFPALPLISEGCVLRHNPEQQEADAAVPNSLPEFSLPSLLKTDFWLLIHLSTTENIR